MLLTKKARSVALSAATEMDEGPVGKHIGAQLIDDTLAVHRFAAEVPGYRGWQWHVSVTAAPGSEHVTVNDVSLIAGRTALTAPEWVPYAERIRPGDLDPETQLPLEEGDPRVVETTDDQGETHREISSVGLSKARRRWGRGSFGPSSEFAQKASHECGSCAFYLQLPEEVGRNFGVCANEYSADGHVVHTSYGCGAHSDTPPKEQLGAPVAVPYDDENPIEL
nr:DUF3027 domain-containing protein [Corynebacterium ciconiae]